MAKDRRVDLGNGVWMRWVSFSPDRELNPQYKGVADEDKHGLIVGHLHAPDHECEGVVLLDTPARRHIKATSTSQLERDRPVWTVESWDPLTLSPSILFRRNNHSEECNFHGYIREGRWVAA